MLMLSQCQTYFDVMSEWPRDCHDPWKNRKNIPIWGGEGDREFQDFTLIQNVQQLAVFSTIKELQSNDKW